MSDRLNNPFMAISERGDAKIECDQACYNDGG
jgi:hypothetical protein